MCMAVAVRGGDVRGGFATDKGGEYTGRLFRRTCANRRHRIDGPHRVRAGQRRRVLRVHVEFELLRARRFTTREQARRGVVEFLSGVKGRCELAMRCDNVVLAHHLDDLGRVAPRTLRWVLHHLVEETAPGTWGTWTCCANS